MFTNEICINNSMQFNFWISWNEKAMPLATLQQKKTQCNKMTAEWLNDVECSVLFVCPFACCLYCCKKFFLRKFIAIEYKVRYAPINAINQVHKLYCNAYKTRPLCFLYRCSSVCIFYNVRQIRFEIDKFILNVVNYSYA